MSDEKLNAPADPTMSDPPPAYSAGPAPSYPTQAGSAPPPAPPSVPRAGGGDGNTRVRADNVKYLRFVPALPLCWAYTIFAVNCCLPGFGMWLACFIMCCGNTVVKGDSMVKVFCIAFGLGFASLLTFALGIGYLIAFGWSYAAVVNSRFYYENPLDESEIQQPPLQEL